MNVPATDTAASSLQALVGMDRKALAKEWVKVFGTPTPRRAQVALLRGALSWRYQIEHEAEKGAEQFIRRLRRQLTNSAPAVVLSPGTRLVREWHGTTHHVTVTSGGFEYGGKTFHSLTAISREITGTPWSGPRFFGVHP